MKRHRDSNYTTNLESRKSMSSLEVTLNRVPILIRSISQKIITLSVTEVELISFIQYI